MISTWMHDMVIKILEYRFMEIQQVNGQYDRDNRARRIPSLPRGSVEVLVT
jgi:hypothetical protein